MGRNHKRAESSQIGPVSGHGAGQVDSQSRSSVSIEKRPSKHPRTPCGDNKCKKLRCDRKIRLALDYQPKVKVTQVASKDAYFDLALNFKHAPKCDIRPLRCERVSDCHERQLYRVTIGADMLSDVCIVNQQPFAVSEFDLNVAATTRQACTDVPVPTNHH